LWIGEEDDIPFPENLIEAQIKMYKEKKKKEEGKKKKRGRQRQLYICL